jgi:hypothetical protein
MPPRYAYWTIIAGGLPTAFRAADLDELLPTFRRLHEKHPDAVLKWFARGRLWDSPEAARQELEARRRSRVKGPRPEERTRSDRGRAFGTERAHRQPSRPESWRPGGDHRDPRQRFKDAKRARNQRLKAARFARKSERPSGTSGPPGRTRPDTPAPPSKERRRTRSPAKRRDGRRRS